MNKAVLKNFKIFTGKHLCHNITFNKVAGLRPEMFSCAFCEIFKNTFFFFIEHLQSLLLYGASTLDQCHNDYFYKFFLKYLSLMSLSKGSNC